MVQLFPSLKKVVFLDDDIVVQADLSPLWDIDLKGKVNGAVETCRGDDKFVMRKRLKNYLNFSHPLIAENFDPHECAWAYGMNIFDLDAWRRTNISLTYHHWLRKVYRFSSATCKYKLSIYIYEFIIMVVFLLFCFKELEIRFELMAVRDSATRFDCISWACSCD